MDIDLRPFINYTDYDESYLSKAEYFGLIGEKDSAFHYLDLIHDNHPISILSNASFAALTNDERWNNLVNTIAHREHISQKEMYKKEWTMNDGAYVFIIKNIAKSDVSEGEKNRLTDILWKKNKIHRRMNVSILKKLVHLNGGYEELGATLFMTLQHVGDTSVMAKYKAAMDDCLVRQIISPYQYAYFTDRYKMLINEKQIYGTQVKKDDLGVFYLYPVEDTLILDSLRKSVGIEISVEDYLEVFGN